MKARTSARVQHLASEGNDRLQYCLRVEAQSCCPWETPNELDGVTTLSFSLANMSTALTALTVRFGHGFVRVLVILADVVLVLVKWCRTGKPAHLQYLICRKVLYIIHSIIECAILSISVTLPQETILHVYLRQLLLFHQKAASAQHLPLPRRYQKRCSAFVMVCHGPNLGCNSTITVCIIPNIWRRQEFTQKVDSVFVRQLCCLDTQHRARETLVELRAAAFSAP